MKKEVFAKRVEKIVSTMTKRHEGEGFESVQTWMGEAIPSVFHYAAICERVMERQLENIGKTERKTTFMSDLSVGEWCDGVAGVLDTVKRALDEWCNNVEYVSELILCINWKSWEHYERSNTAWAKFYSELYESTLDLMYDYYHGDEEKTSYLWSYLD